MTALPGILGEIEDVAGLAAALAVAQAVGGTRQYIPGSAPDGHWLVDTVGRDAADRICAHFALTDAHGRASGTLYTIPMGPTGSAREARRRLRQALAKGASARDAAQIAGVHERTAWRAKAKLKTDDGQDDLFASFPAQGGDSSR
ncbi:hypothetical protein [Notoacmeibacter ruber]|uniref:Uncharacterized protein n=1 Tax=Notoacmeibacter ruber TaxID=2670375 RepID=A0A3L7JDP9_9HYPH|nr:hypothetical protein [Notoacmeibacter ruber]RLQ88897.1 hypothetical protein D8780_12340 [Notoacmeibacter ruber]